MRKVRNVPSFSMAPELQAFMFRPKFALIAAGCLIGGYTVANALFLQQTEHPASLFAMRDAPTAQNGLLDEDLVARSSDGRNVTRIVFQGQQAEKADRLASQSKADTQATQPLPAAAPGIAQRPPKDQIPASNDGSVEQLQQLLAQLGFYNGDVDGKSGPMTAAAIENYKTSAGLQGIDLSNDQLITSARNNLLVTAAIPAQRPDVAAPRRTKTVTYSAPSDAADTVTIAQPLPARDLSNEATIRQVQQALRDYAGDHIVVDGVFGSQTSKAIAEFQSVFRMKVTGEISEELVQRMVDVGMIDG